jgi:drug/metabolite transporter (DMT)-like permease
MSQPILRGYLLALLGVLILSPDALLVRLVGDEPLLISTWRGLIGGCMVLVYNQFLDKRSLLKQLRPVGIWVFAAILFNGLSQIGFVYGVSHTNATDVLVIIAFAPLVSAFLSAIFLSEKVKPRTWFATLICGVGLAILLSQSASGSQWLGLVAAVVCAVTLAAQFVIMRAFPGENLTGCVGLGNLLSGVVCALIAGDMSLGGVEWPPLLLMSLVVTPMSFMLFVLSLRYISAAETSLIMLMESILGSFWIWLVLSEQPSLKTTLAGTLIISTLLVYSWLSLKEEKQSDI